MEKVFALPLTDGILSSHFGHCEQFYFAKVKDGKIVESRLVTPPGHEPGLYPRWVKEQGGEMVIAGGMGQKACNLFDQNGVEYVTGATPDAPEKVVEAYLAGTLVATGEKCQHNHDHGEGHEHHHGHGHEC